MTKKTVIVHLIITLLIPFIARSAHQDQPTVLIFDRIPVFVRNTFPFPNLEWKEDRPQITIFDNFYETNFNPKPLVRDTIFIYPNNSKILVTFLYSKTKDPLNYLVSNGDTITFSFINGVPVAKSTQPVNNVYLNSDYDLLQANEASHQTNTSYDIYNNPFIKAKDLNDAINNFYTIRKDQFNGARSFLSNELSLLHNRRDLKENAPEIFNLLEDKLTYKIAELEFEQHALPTENLKTILTRNKQESIHFPYSYFLPLLEKISDSVNVKTAKLLRFENGSQIDFRDAYDKTSNWTAINDFYKKQLLFKYLKKIGTDFSTLDLQLYLSKFAAFSNDTLLVKKIKTEFLIPETPQRLGKDSLYMVNANNKRLSLQELLNLNKGKLIYIDFWASWCAPCMQEMKHTENLRELFKNQDVVFVYISMDKSQAAWIKAFDAGKLDMVQHNYILTNADVATFIKSIELISVPRYLLYDKKGTLVHKNAPGPGSEEIRRLLTEYLKK